MGRKLLRRHPNYHHATRDGVGAPPTNNHTRRTVRTDDQLPASFAKVPHCDFPDFCDFSQPVAGINVIYIIMYFFSRVRGLEKVAKVAKVADLPFPNSRDTPLRPAGVGTIDREFIFTSHGRCGTSQPPPQTHAVDTI